MHYLRSGSWPPTVTLVLSLWVSLIGLSLSETYDLDSQWKYACPRIYLTVFVGYAPKGNMSAGAYIKREGIDTIEKCIAGCCESDTCNVVFMYDSKCYQITCNVSEVDLCSPIYRSSPQFGSHVQMVLVQPPNADDWNDVIDLSQIDSAFLLEKDGTMEMSGSDTKYLATPYTRTCEVGVVIDCPPHEICKPMNRRSHNGVCECDDNYIRNNSTGDCFKSDNVMSDSPDSQPLKSSDMDATPDPVQSTKVYAEGEVPRKDAATETTPAKPTVKLLVVSAISKEVRLPENEAMLSAYTVPAAQPNEPYNYVWKLLTSPEGGNSGTMNDQNGGTLKLSRLVEGLYTFQVSVSAAGGGAYGETFANVTVLPAKRINQPPTAIITPESQTVKLPNTGAVLDGSTSKDDDTIIGWKWELQQGPIGYQPRLEDKPLLQLDNLRLPGNYTFKLTVEDSDHVTSFTTANIMVLKETDYPPEANAGQDVIVYLPHNNLTLNGSLSTDDRGIASWEWTKSPTDQDKAVDMQNTRTPYLQLSNLEEGMYTFVLKVTDNSSQVSTAMVHVFVKQPANSPPVADAGADITVALPQTWVTLDGSKSSDDIKVVGWNWELIKGPSKVNFAASNSSRTNVTDLTKGQYEIQLTVSDELNNTAKDTVVITVTQNTNARPKANGGGDQSVFLPVTVVVLNGTQSSDDLGVVKWEWTREPNSLAMGRVIGKTDSSPVLMLTDVVPGRYIYRLRVTDDQGMTDEDTVSVIVKQDVHLPHLVELTLNIEGQMLTKTQEDSLEMKLALLLRDKASIHVQQLRVQDNTGRAVVVFYVERENKVLPGPEVVQRLKEKLRQDSGLLELSVASMQTVLCQNNCSGHGVCDQSTRQCLCEAFWMQDLIGRHFGDGDANCDWSILYVVIVLLTSVLLTVGSAWALVCFCQRACVRRPRKRQRYALLDDGEDDAMIPRMPHEKIPLTDSDSDSDVLFESRKGNKLNGHARNGHAKAPRNGFMKMGRRVKT